MCRDLSALILCTIFKTSILILSEIVKLAIPQKLFLPPANQVWGKVMFLHLSISHSVHGGGGMHGRGHVWQGVCVCGKGGMRSQGHVWCQRGHAHRRRPLKQAVCILLDTC